MLSAVLLAAGPSRRMGNINKLLLPFRGKTILAVTAEQVLAAGIEEVIVVTGYEAAAVEQAVLHLPVRIIHNPRHEEGMTSSIQAGVSQATGQGYMICLSDMVLIDSTEYSLLRQAFESRYPSDDRCIIQPVYKGEKGNPVIFAGYYRSAILHHEEKEGCKGIIHPNAAHLLLVDMPSAHILRDIDYPAEYQALPG